QRESTSSGARGRGPGVSRIRHRHFLTGPRPLAPDPVSMKRLIVNADDFGFTRGVNAGILRASESGILTSATLMANGDAFGEAVEMALANPRLGVGCHLVAVGGRPVAPPSEIPSL